MAAQDVAKQAKDKQGVQIPTKPTVIRHLIDKSGWEVDELAQSLGVTAGQVEDWMTTSKTVGFDYLLKLEELTMRQYSRFTSGALPDVGDPADYRALPKGKPAKMFRHSVGPTMLQATNLAECAPASAECGQIMAGFENNRPKPADKFSTAGYIDKCVVRTGKKLIRLVLEEEEKGLIHESNVMRYLDIGHGDMYEVGKKVYE